MSIILLKEQYVSFKTVNC